MRAKNEAATATASAAAAAVFSPMPPRAPSDNACHLGLSRLTPNRRPRFTDTITIHIIGFVANVILYAIAYEIYNTIYS